MQSKRMCADLNITPLVDVALVLLILAMATAPAAQKAYPVDIPRAASHDEKPRSRENPVVALAADGSVTLGGATVTLEGLPALLLARNVGPGATVLFRADEDAAYERVIAVVDRIRASGAGIGIVTGG